MKKPYKFTLQTKIMSLVMIIVAVIISLLVSVFAYLESSDTKEETAKLAIQTAANVAYMPEVRNSLAAGDQEELQGLAELIRDQVDAASVIVTDRDNRIYSHPDASKIGQVLRDPDSEKALVFAGRYTAEGPGSFGPSLKGKAPILLDEGNYQEVSGLVTVEFLEKDIQEKIAGKMTKLALYTLPVLAAGIMGSVLLARNIRKDTLGLEPSQISALYRERSSILSSLGEGILALDDHGNVTLMNPAAEEMLGSEYRDHWFPKLEDLRQIGLTRNAEMSYRDRVMIVNHDIIFEKGKAAGMVWTFKDKTEFVKMIDTLSEVNKYSEDLRAQTHEYTNKLYVISGLLELGKVDEALDLINEESIKSQNQNQVLFEQIKDSKLQAILLGKIGKASEKKIAFTIDRESSVGQLPDRIGMSSLITIAGNLIDNAFDAVSQQDVREVLFFVTDLGRDLVLEVEDNGPGISYNQDIFQQGVSTKGHHRGYGLSNVKAAVEELGGVIETSGSSGAVFTVSIPKGEKE